MHPVIKTTGIGIQTLPGIVKNKPMTIKNSWGAFKHMQAALDGKLTVRCLKAAQPNYRHRNRAFGFSQLIFYLRNRYFIGSNQYGMPCN